MRKHDQGVCARGIRKVPASPTAELAHREFEFELSLAADARELNGS